jgi:hypothetical protein
LFLPPFLSVSIFLLINFISFGYPGLQSYIHVDDKDGNELLHILSLPELGINPYDELRTKFAEWREANPCPSGGGEEGSGNETSGGSTDSTENGSPTTSAPAADGASSAATGNGFSLSVAFVSFGWAMLL